MDSGHTARIASFATFITLAAPAMASPECGALSHQGDPSVLRIRADDARGRTWILATDGVYLHDQASARVKHYALPAWRHAVRWAACPPDLVIDGSGAAIASSNVVPHLWRIDPARASAEWIPLLLGHESARDVGFTRLESLQGGVVRAHNAIDASAWRIDLRAGRAWQVEASQAAR